MTDDKTPALTLPLPHPGNLLEDDVPRLRQALRLIDAALDTLMSDGAAQATDISTTQGKIDKANAALLALQGVVDYIKKQGASAIFDGGFERDDSWTYATNSGWSIQAGVGRNGTRAAVCLAHTGTATLSPNISAMGVPVQPGQTWRIRCWYQTSADYNGTAGNSKLRGADQNGSLLNSITPPLLVSTSWKCAQAIYTVPASGVTALRVIVVADNTVGTIWVDDIELSNITETEEVRALAVNLAQLPGGVLQTSAVAGVRGGLEFDAQPGQSYDIDTRIGHTTLWLPASAPIGAWVRFNDLYRNFQTSPLVIAGRGDALIEGTRDPLLIDLPVSGMLEFRGGARGWILV